MLLDVVLLANTELFGEKLDTYCSCCPVVDIYMHARMLTAVAIMAYKHQASSIRNSTIEILSNCSNPHPLKKSITCITASPIPNALNLRIYTARIPSLNPGDCVKPYYNTLPCAQNETAIHRMKHLSTGLESASNWTQFGAAES